MPGLSGLSNQSRERRSFGVRRSRASAIVILPRDRFLGPCGPEPAGKSTDERAAPALRLSRVAPAGEPPAAMAPVAASSVPPSLPPGVPPLQEQLVRERLIQRACPVGRDVAEQPRRALPVVEPAGVVGHRVE